MLPVDAKGNVNDVAKRSKQRLLNLKGKSQKSININFAIIVNDCTSFYGMGERIVITTIDQQSTKKYKRRPYSWHDRESSTARKHLPTTTPSRSPTSSYLHGNPTIQIDDDGWSGMVHTSKTKRKRLSLSKTDFPLCFACKLLFSSGKENSTNTTLLRSSDQNMINECPMSYPSSFSKNVGTTYWTIFWGLVQFVRSFVKGRHTLHSCRAGKLSNNQQTSQTSAWYRGG